MGSWELEQLRLTCVLINRTLLKVVGEGVRRSCQSWDSRSTKV